MASWSSRKPTWPATNTWREAMSSRAASQGQVRPVPPRWSRDHESSMIGSSVPNSRLRPYQRALDEGRILLMIDVPHHRVDEVRDRLNAIHPEADCRGLDPHVPAFP